MVKGLSRLKRKMTVTIPQRVRQATRSAMEKGATEIVALMKARVPRDSGDLEESIGWTWGDAPGGSMILGQVRAAREGDERITIYAGNEAAYYARFVEFGTQNMSPRPFFYVTYRQLKRRTKSRITREMKKAIRAGAR
jgi:HK97 gp10 family phage protein